MEIKSTITGMKPQSKRWKQIPQQAAGDYTLRFAGLFNLPIPPRFAYGIGVSRINGKYIYIVITLLIVVSLAAFGRIAGNDFINLDDNKYVTENNDIQSGLNLKSIKWAATTVVVGNWHPLTLLSHMLDWRLFGGNASGHHMVSLLLHIGAVIFLFLFLNKTTKSIWPSAFAAALFAIHPLRVESVAWIAERKDVLSMFFGMACIYAYAFYAEKANVSRYLICLMLFAMALMAKPMMVTIPFLLLLMDYWPLKRWQKSMISTENIFNSAGKIIWEKIPFIFLSIFSSFLAFWAQNKFGAMDKIKDISFVGRFFNAIVSYFTYLEKTFWPANLAVYYPYDFPLSWWNALISVITILLITVVVLYYIKKLPFFFIGWFWYLGTLIPVIGLVQIGSQAMADRYTYLPSIGIGIMIAWGVPLLFPSKLIRKIFLLPAGMVTITLLAVLTWQQCGHWKNSITLFSRTLHLTKNNYIAHNHLASALFKKRFFDKAIYHYNEAIRINPIYAHAYYNRGITYYALGQKMRALNDFKEAIKSIPKNSDYAAVYNNIGVIYSDFGQFQMALANYSEAIRLNPNYSDALNNRAYVYLKNNNNSSGCSDAQKACILGNCKSLEAARIGGLCR